MVEFFRKAWRGEEQLWKVLSLIVVILGVQVSLETLCVIKCQIPNVNVGFLEAFEPGIGMSGMSALFPVAVFFIQIVIYIVWWTMLLRCAKNTNKKVYGIIAKLFIILGLVSFFSSITQARESVEIERLYKTFINKMSFEKKEYLLAIDSISWSRILNPERVSQDKTLKESMMMIQKAKEIVGKYRIETDTLFEDTRKAIDTLNASNSRQELASGTAKWHAHLDAFWDLETKTISEFENIVALLVARKGAWVVQEGNIIFSTEKDLNTFNSYITAIQELVMREEEIQKQPIEDVSKNLDKQKN